MKTVKLRTASWVHGVHRPEGDSVLVPDDLAEILVKSASGDVVPDGPVHNPEVNHLMDAVEPAVANADPRHDQVASGLRADQNPGLAALDVADAKGPPVAAPKRVAKPEKTS